MGKVHMLPWADFLRKTKTAGFRQIVLEQRVHLLGGRQTKVEHLLAAHPFRKLILHAYSRRISSQEQLGSGRVYGVISYNKKDFPKIMSQISTAFKLGEETSFFYVVIDALLPEKLDKLASLGTFVAWPRRTPLPNLIEPEKTTGLNAHADAWIRFMKQSPQWVRDFAISSRP